MTDEHVIHVQGLEKSFRDLPVLRGVDFGASRGAAHPEVVGLRELLAERGWEGWTRVARRAG